AGDEIGQPVAVDVRGEQRRRRISRRILDAREERAFAKALEDTDLSTVRHGRDQVEVSVQIEVGREQGSDPRGWEAHLDTLDERAVDLEVDRYQVGAGDREVVSAVAVKVADGERAGSRAAPQ